MSRHEENLENSLEAYEEQAGQNVLERWMKFTPDAPGDDLLSDIEIHPEMSVDEVIDMAMEFDERLITFYRQISESTTVPAVRQLFSNLVEQEEAEEHMAARVAIEADSY